MKAVAILCAMSPSVYDGLDGVVVYNKQRDARTFSGGMPVVAHPPCAQWGRLHHFAKDDAAERELAVLCVDHVRCCGGVLEHPFPSRLWREARMPAPGERDEWGGFTLPLDQMWFGHRARKRTLLYISGLSPTDLPSIDFTIGTPEAVIETERRGLPGALPADSRQERSATPRAFAEWLVSVARLSTVRQEAVAA